MDAFPALEESRDRLLSALDEREVISADVVRAIESDLALSIAVLREANGALQGHKPIDTIVAAVEALSADSIRALASRVPTFGFFEQGGAWGSVPAHLRLHALATQRAAERIARLLGYEHTDRLAVTSLLHDVGRLALVRAYPSYPPSLDQRAATPSARLHQERRMLGFDHAVLGGVLIRRWGLPASLATAVERHHDPEAGGEAALVGLADMLAHYEGGAPVDPRELLARARAVGLGPKRLRRLMYEPPAASSRRLLAVDPCPLSSQELRVLQLLSEGCVYKEIAAELGLSVSTIRSHLHGIYKKLGAPDRAQAVICASKRGWLQAA